MGNLSYCRFENTTKDLADCLVFMDETDLTYSEEKFRLALINYCCDIALKYGEDIGRDIEEAF